MTVTVKKDWLHACGRREYDGDTAFPVVGERMVRGEMYYDITVPWSSTPWTVWAIRCVWN